MENPSIEILPRLAETLKGARHVVVLTGAGVSAESGVPTFREALTGLWAQFNPEELATPEAFRRNPKLVWEWYAMRREMIQRVEPNAGHLALAEIERRVPRFTLITQNVDSLHQRAGSRRVLELHGNISRAKCFREETIVTAWREEGSIPPRCPNCGSYLRPDVVWFGEMLPAQAMQEALEAAQSGDFFFSIGTSGLVEPAASLPYEALEHGATLVEVNPETTPLSDRADFRLRGPSGRILPALVRAAWKK